MKEGGYQPHPEAAPTLPRTGEVFSRDDRVTAALTRLEAGFDSLVDSDTFKQYLEVMSRFHKYSPNNLMLIMQQRPDATMVMGYGDKAGKTGWKSVGRNVRRGEHGIQILAPLLHKEIDPETGETTDRLYGYKPVYVYDVSQTEGKPVPTSPALEATRVLQGSSAQAMQLGQYLYDHVTAKGVTVEWEKDLPYNGYFRPRENHIGLKNDLEMNQACKTLCHEVAHFTAEHRGWGNREDFETVAEGAAFVTLNHFGMDTSGYSLGYVATWAQDKAVLKRNIGQIKTVATSMIDGIEAVAGKGER